MQPDLTISEIQQLGMQLFDDPTVIRLVWGGGAGPQPLDATVWTPFGPKTMADMKVGSQVSAPDGTVSRVIDIPYEGEEEVYRITFADGAVTEAAHNHIWKTKIAGKS